MTIFRSGRLFGDRGRGSRGCGDRLSGGQLAAASDPSAEGTPITGVVVGGMLGLVAFLMAFSIGIVIGQHNGRKAMVVTEANAVGTAYLRAGFLGEPDLTTSRDLLREYVELRLAAASDLTQFEPAITRSEEIHDELWSIVEDKVRQGNETDIMAIYVESINEVIDVHSLRLAAVNIRLPRFLAWCCMQPRC